MKTKSNDKKVKKIDKYKNKWSKVKISGNLVSDDGGGLEGLVGLEVLEDYDIGTVLSEKVRICRCCKDEIRNFSQKNINQI